MALIRGLHNLRPEHKPSVVTIGNFDGVHLGHQAVVKQLQACAERLHLPPTIVIFEPQPLEFLAPAKAPVRLMSLREKISAIAGLGEIRLLCVQFNQALSMQTPMEFIQTTLVRGLGVQHLVIGDDFQFGRQRKGDYGLLVSAGKEYGFTVERTHTFEIDNERVSSTRIREALSRGKMKLAATLLGRPYTVEGSVIRGDQIGRRLGVPTANVKIAPRCLPCKGVFVARINTASGIYEGVANLGVRPTVDGVQERAEAHLFDFSDDLYGQRISVELLERIRVEEKFNSEAALRAAIERDIQQAKAWFS